MRFSWPWFAIWIGLLSLGSLFAMYFGLTWAQYLGAYCFGVISQILYSTKVHPE